MALPNKTAPEWIYNANTKGPWSETRGPGIGGPGPWSFVSTVAIGLSNPLPLVRAPGSLDCGTAGCTRTRHLRCACGLLTYCYCNDCTRTKVLGKASNPVWGHHFNQDPWIKYLICKEHGPWPTDFAARHCNNAAYGPKQTLETFVAKVGFEPSLRLF